MSITSIGTMSTDTPFENISRQLRMKCRCDGEIRLVVLSISSLPKVDYQTMYKSLCADYGFNVALKYTDFDGDLITLASQNDLDNLITSAIANNSQSIDVFVSELLSLPDIAIKRNTNTAARYPLHTPLASPLISFAKMPSIPPLFSSASSQFSQVNIHESHKPSTSFDMHNQDSHFKSTLSNDLATFPLNISSRRNKRGDIKWKRGEIIGQGAFGVVYLGLNIESGELLAVKQMALEEVSSKELSSLENEINLLRTLRHANIVRYIGTEITPAALSIFLEYIPGGSLKSLLEKFGPLEENVVRSYTRQLLLGLEYLHRNGIAHRDIKGANCLVGNDGVVKLADFGASKHWRPAPGPGATVQSTKSGDIKGTPSWMAPELVREQGGVISWRKADVWSLACTTLEMTSGQPPWSQFNNHVTILYHLACTESSPEYPANASIELITFLNLCLQRDPSRRPDITSLLLHPFVSGAGWTSAVARPSTVSTAAAWAWESSTARDPPRRAVDLAAREQPATSREPLLELPPKIKEQLRRHSSEEMTGFTSISLQDVKAPAVDHSDSESTTASAPRRRRARGKGKASKEAKRDKKRGGGGAVLEERETNRLHRDTSGQLTIDSLEESKDSVDWTMAGNGSDDEILEEIDESYEDSMEMVEMLSGSAMYPPFAGSLHELSVDAESLADEKSVKVPPSTGQSKASKSSSGHGHRKAGGGGGVTVGKDRGNTRQSIGLGDSILKSVSASTSFLDARQSPSPDLVVVTSGLKVSQSQRSIGPRLSAISTPRTALERNKRAKERVPHILLTHSRSDAVDLEMYGDSLTRVPTATYLEESGDDGRLEDSRLNLLDLESGSVQSLNEHQGAVTRLFAPKKSSILLSSSMDGTIRIWGNLSTESRCVLDTASFTVSTSLSEAVLSGDAAGRRSTAPSVGRTGEGVPSIKVTQMWADEQCELIWGGCADYNIRVWQGDGRPLRFIRGHDDSITCFDGMSSEGIQTTTLLASGSVDRTVRLFDVRSKKPQISLFRGHTDSVLTVKLADGGRTIISGSKDKTIKLFDTRTGRLRLTLEKHFGAVSCLRLVSDLQLGKGDGLGFVSGGRDSMMNVWSMAGDCLASQPAHRGALTRMSAASDGVNQVFFTAGADALVKIWDMKRIRLLGEVKTGAVSDLLSQQNAFVSSSSSGLVRLWSLGGSSASLSAEGRTTAREWIGTDLAQHSSPCTDLVSGADFVACASKSGAIYRWVMP